MTAVTITENPEATDSLCEGVASLYASIGWGEGYTTESIRAALPHTDHYLVALNEKGGVIGLLRAFTDGVFVTWLGECAVARAYQQRGVGKGLMKAFLEKFAHTSIYLEAFTENRRFFETCGMRGNTGLAAFSRKKMKE